MSAVPTKRYNAVYGRVREECGCSTDAEDFCEKAFPDNYGTARSSMLYDDLCRDGSQEYWYSLIHGGNYKNLNELAEAIAADHLRVLKAAVRRSEGWVADMLENMVCYDIDFTEIGVATVAYWSVFPPEDTQIADFKGNFLCGLEWDDDFEWKDGFNEY